MTTTLSIPNADNSGKWSEVTKGFPCDICGKPDWCTRNGGLVRCMRVAEPRSGFRIVKPDSDGGTVYGPEQPMAGQSRKGSGAKPKRYSKAHGSIEDLVSALEASPAFGDGRPTVYRYTPTFAVIRFDFAGGREKTFRPVHRDPDGWRVGDPSGPLPLYNLEAAHDADAVWIVEGEKCVEAMRAIGLVAVTSAHGAKGAQRSDWAPIAGKEVRLLTDRNAVGREYVEVVGCILSRLNSATRIKLLDPPWIPEGQDIADVVNAVSENQDQSDIARQLEELADKAAPWVPENAIRAPIGKDLARIELQAAWEPVPLSQLSDEDDVEWDWHGYLAKRHISLFTGIWKAGKTTLIAHALRLFGEGGILVGAIRPGAVLVISEESTALWRRRRDQIRIGDHVHVICRPFKSRANAAEWSGLLRHVAELVRTRAYSVAIFDPLTALWPVADENDAAKVTDALLPLYEVTEAGASVMLVHHPRKGDGAEGQASRGSGALPGFVDIILELRRFNPGNRTDKRRVLTGYSRFDETPTEIVIELGDEGFHTVGTKRDASQSDRLSVLSQLIPAAEPGTTAKELHEKWPEAIAGPKPAIRSIQIDLRAGVAAGCMIESGSGKKADPYRYRLKNPIRASIGCIGARNESEASSPVPEALIPDAGCRPNGRANENSQPA